MPSCCLCVVNAEVLSSCQVHALGARVAAIPTRQSLLGASASAAVCPVCESLVMWYDPHLAWGPPGSTPGAFLNTQKVLATAGEAGGGGGDCSASTGSLSST